MSGSADKPKPACDGEAVPPGAGKRILIVDDSEITIEMIRAELDGKGFEVLTACRAEEATSLLLKKATRPHLILLDIHMPNIDGQQFCRFVKGNSLFSGIKVVLCSGIPQDQLKEIAAANGADGYVCKDSFLGKRVSEELTPCR
jgi:CheY-like chemotaxis protein